MKRVNKQEELSVHEIFTQILEKKLDPKLLSTRQRQECVESMKIGGAPYAAMAEILEMSTMAIKSDLVKIWARNGAMSASDQALNMFVYGFRCGNPRMKIKTEYLYSVAKRYFNGLGYKRHPRN